MSEASRIRYKIAHELAQLCPPVLGQEIVLTGSTSQGIADEASDIEQVFYVDAVPSLEEREKWLYEADATEIILADIISHAVPLRSQGLLAKWQQELAHYPDGLPERLIADATELWLFPHTAAVRWAVCMQLICDTLLLVPPQYDVTRALNTIQESLRTNNGF